MHLAFRYLHRHWLQRELDEDKTGLWNTYQLCLIQWQRQLSDVSDIIRRDLVALETAGKAPQANYSQLLVLDINEMQSIRSKIGIAGGLLDMETATAVYGQELARLLDDLHATLSSGLDEINAPQRDEPLEDVATSIRFTTADEAFVEADRRAAECSTLVKLIIGRVPEECLLEETIPLPGVNEPVLRKVLEWCDYHKDDAMYSAWQNSLGWLESYSHLPTSMKRTTDIEDWDREFTMVDEEMLFEIILAANYLEIRPLVDLGCKVVANMIKGLGPDGIRRTFNITNDFTPEEEDQIRRKND